MNTVSDMSTTCRPCHRRLRDRPLQITANNLVKRVKRTAFGFRRFQHDRLRVLLYAGRPNWSLLQHLTPP